jgi:glycosyltransferase involved in cell wall biosynthesis
MVSREGEKKIVVFATKGTGTNEELRIVELASQLNIIRLDFDKKKKLNSFFFLSKTIYKIKPDLIVMEGTGLAGGAALLLIHLILGTKYIVSSGDAVGPYVGGRIRVLRGIFQFYERILCKFSSGFVGWTPYLVGRALTFGAPRAMTAAGWNEYQINKNDQEASRKKIREKYSIPQDAIVIGIVGSLNWSKRYSYCYGLEIVRAFRNLERTDLYAFIVGGGDGLNYLFREKEEHKLTRVKFAGQVKYEEVLSYLSAIDIVTLPQSVNEVGNFRYTTKISEYLAAGLPVFLNQTPFSYDFCGGWFWRLRGDAPWSPKYIKNLCDILNVISKSDIEEKKKKVPIELGIFQKSEQVARFTEFCNDILCQEGY